MYNQIKFKIYMSHCIRGKSGSKATDREIWDNIEKYKSIGEELRAYFIDWEKMDGFPKIELYVPADHEEFVQVAWRKGYIDEEQVLDVDCDIVDRCSLLILFGDYYSKGMKVEGNYAGKVGIPIFNMPLINEVTIQALKFSIHLLLTGGDG